MYRKTSIHDRSGGAGPAPPRDLVLGIDTGGTFTDGVLLDYRSRKVLASAKSPTTPEDLRLGVDRVLEALSIPAPERVRLVGISSTLATNAIAENKARDVGLLLVGYDPDLIARFGLDARFEAQVTGYVGGGHTCQGEEQQPLDVHAIRRWVLEHAQSVEAIAISSYFSPLDPSHEERALEVVRGLCALPVVLGHQLSTRLDSVKRAATACLNASLVAVMQAFIQAVRRSLERQRIQAPLMVVKGDGSLMSDVEAVERPVETVLSGPAASAIGGRFLTGRDRALVVDIGGTTTDIAVVDGAATALCEDGVRVGDLQTAVRAARVRTACIGCDSQIAITEGEIAIGPDRCIPLSRLADAHPEVEEQILRLNGSPSTWLSTDIEYWVLSREPAPRRAPGAGSAAAHVLERLRRGPASVSALLQDQDAVVPAQLGVDELLRRRVIERACLTPTDLLHAAGDLDLWSRSAATQAVARFCAMHGRTPERFVAETLEQVVARIVEEVVVFLATSEDRDDQLPARFEETGWGRWLLDRAVRRDHPFLAVAIGGRSLPLVGIGAPADLLARRVADKLDVPFVLPPFSDVANAVGAVAGSVVVAREAIVYQRESANATCFTVQVGGDRRSFEEADESLRYAERRARELAEKGARAAGAVELNVVSGVTVDGSLQRVLAQAVGNPRLAQPEPAPRSAG